MVLVDEAGMVDHVRYVGLLEAAVRSGATIVQIGDDRQLSPVGPGGLWTVTHRMAESAGRAVELDVVRRARDRREAKAWGDLRHGRIAEALTWMRDEGRLTLYETRPELLEGLVDDWWAGDRDGLMVVDTSNAERDRLNERAQVRRLAAGQLGEEVVRLQSGRELRRGDQILFSGIYRPEPKDGPRAARVENGTPAVVVHVDTSRQRATVELTEGDQVRIDVGPDAPLELGYARHVAKAQGVTHEDTDLGVSNRTRRNELYVMASRARSGARFHALTADVAELLGGGAEPDVTPMTVAQATVLERHGVAPNLDWTWVQASLHIDAVVGKPIGRQAALWLEAQGHSRESAASIVETARASGPTSDHTHPASPSAGMTVSEMEAQTGIRG